MSMNPENNDDLTKLDAVLIECINLLGEAFRLSDALDLGLKDKALKQIAAAVGNILCTQTFIPEDARIDKDKETPIPDEPLTAEQQERISQLTEGEIQAIDDALLGNATVQWRKMAMLIMLAMAEKSNEIQGIPDVYYAQRLRRLVENGLLESQGNLDSMRFCEVRLPKSRD
ncbi:MAG TPA: DUF3658 domain-containing protein [Pyrinomonadaceae bacterium]|nr:DUF3658 domain-containing protein [Pyrinomonadaceae bacterium]